MMVSAETSVGKRTFIGWPFSQDILVLVPDSVFKYEKMTVVPGSSRLKPSPICTLHTARALKTRAEWIETFYPKKLVMMGNTVLLNIRPLKQHRQRN